MTNPKTVKPFLNFYRHLSRIIIDISVERLLSNYNDLNKIYKWKIIISSTLVNNLRKSPVHNTYIMEIKLKVIIFFVYLFFFSNNFWNFQSYNIGTKKLFVYLNNLIRYILLIGRFTDKRTRIKYCE